ncbi:MAG: hypothetical protein ABJZ55_12990 [Fuerstiella sp.]
MARKFRRNQNDGGSILAAMIVIVLGAILCSWIVLVSESALQDWMIACIVIGAVLVITCLLLFRYGGSKPAGLDFWRSAFGNHYDDGLAANYRPAKVKDRTSAVGQAENRPVSASELRDIRETSANSWVPAGPAKPQD